MIRAQPGAPEPKRDAPDDLDQHDSGQRGQKPNVRHRNSSSAEQGETRHKSLDTSVERLTTPLENLKDEDKEELHAIRMHVNNEMEEIQKSEYVHVLERGRETRPTAPVHRDTAEHVHKE